MKVIDLLNKIANGEEVPEKIKYRNKIFIYDKDNQCYVVENYNEYYDLHMSLSDHKGTDLNYEVEIIEEPKEIPKRIQSNGENLYSEYIGQWLINKENYTEYDELLMNKINEIIDYLESKGK